MFVLPFLSTIDLLLAASRNSTGDLLDDPQSGKTPTNLGLLMGEYRMNLVLGYKSEVIC